MFCANCGSNIDDPRAVFCPECGASTDDSGGGGYEAPAPPHAAAFASHSAPSHHAPPPSYPQAPPPPTPMYQSHYAPPAGSRAPKKPVPKKMIAIIGGGVAAVVLIVVLIIVLAGGNRIVGTWEDTSGGTWQGRLTFNRNGTGISFEVNMNTGMVRDEAHIRWSVDRILGREVLEIVWIDPFNPLWTDTEMFHFEINRNMMGDDILTLEEFGGWWTEHLRRVR